MQHARLDERLRHLLDKEGIPLGLGCDQPAQLGGHCGRVEERARHVAHLARREGLERQTHVVAAISEGLPVARSVGEEQQRPGRGNGIGQEREKLLGRRIDPVQVLDHEHHRLVPGRSKELRLKRAKRLAAAGAGLHRLDLGVAHRKREQLANERQRPRQLSAL